MKVFLAILIIIVQVHARQQFVSRIPNGDINTCLNCHVSSEGGDSPNLFGLDFAKNGLIWDSILAKVDSDKDGFTNGEELLDPNGLWKNGTIGDLAYLSLPGNPKSKPTNLEFEEINDIIILTKYVIELQQPDDIVSYKIFDFYGRELEIRFPIAKENLNELYVLLLIETKKRKYILKLYVTL
jgi:hypothetical protein